MTREEGAPGEGAKPRALSRTPCPRASSAGCCSSACARAHFPPPSLHTDPDMVPEQGRPDRQRPSASALQADTHERTTAPGAPGGVGHRTRLRSGRLAAPRLRAAERGDVGPIQLPQLLTRCPRGLCPQAACSRWPSRGTGNSFQRWELSFTLSTSAYTCWQSFSNSQGDRQGDAEGAPGHPTTSQLRTVNPGPHQAQDKSRSWTLT